MMATPQSAGVVNGVYPTHEGYAGATNNDEQSGAHAHSHSHSHSSVANATGPAPGAFGSQHADVPSGAGGATGNNSHAEVPKDEVGWYFVEQYYTNLSRSPDKLHLFYSKRSQFVSGVEAEKAQVAVGRTAIAENIKKLAWNDCKVRVSNVDSQASFQNIVIQVIGEMSNDGAPHRKFVQTFVLAEQPNGYFVLNDIFRYINDDDDDLVVPDVEQPQPQPQPPPPPPPEADGRPKEVPSVGTDSSERQEAEDRKPPTTEVAAALSQQPDVEQVDAKLETVLAQEDRSPRDNESQAESAPIANGVDDDRLAESDDVAQGTPTKDPDGTPPPAPPAEARPAPERTEPLAEERPKEPQHTPVAVTPTPTTAEATPPTGSSSSSSTGGAHPPPPKPAGPKTWANLVAASSSPLPASPPSAQSSSSSQVPPPRSAPSQAAASGSPGDAREAREAQPSPATSGAPAHANAGWQTAGNDHAKRQARPPSVSGPGGDKVLAYIKNVTEKISTEDLRRELLKYGELAYFDVSRPKSCAFVEFSTPAGYSAAVAANPHSIAGEPIWVEERRPRSTAYGGSSYYSNRGGGGGGGGGGGPGRGRGGPDGRPPYNPGRGGYPKDGGGRGSFGPGRARGGPMPPRGRPAPPSA